MSIPLLKQVGVCKNPEDSCTEEEKNLDMIQWLQNSSEAARATYFNATGFSGCDLTTYDGVDKITKRPVPKYVSRMITNIDNHYPANFHAMLPLRDPKGEVCVIYGKKGDSAANFIENNRDKYLNKYCKEIYHLEPSIEGLLDNYTQFTTKSVTQEDGSSESIFLPHGFNSPEECRSFIKSNVSTVGSTMTTKPLPVEVEPLGL